MEVVNCSELVARAGETEGRAGEREREREAKAFLIFLELETRWFGRLSPIIDRISAAAANVLIHDRPHRGAARRRRGTGGG